MKNYGEALLKIVRLQNANSHREFFQDTEGRRSSRNVPNNIAQWEELQKEVVQLSEIISRLNKKGIKKECEEKGWPVPWEKNGKNFDYSTGHLK